MTPAAKTFLVIVIIVVALIALAPESEPWQPSAAQREVVAYLMSDEEPTVKDAIWTSGYMLKAGVLNDGNSRNGFAQYLCEVLRERDLHRGTTVQVIDIARLARDGDWVTLGQARCD